MNSEQEQKSGLEWGGPGDHVAAAVARAREAIADLEARDPGALARLEREQATYDAWAEAMDRDDNRADFSFGA